MQAISLGVLAGALLNAKITLLPFVLVAVLFSKRFFIVLTTTIAFFLMFVYVPNLVGSKSTLMMLVDKIINWNNLQSMSFHYWGNHTFYIIYFAIK